MGFQLTEQSRVAVLMGGKAAEREVSLRSGAAVTAALQAQGIAADAIDVSSLHQLAEIAEAYDVAFIALHGRWGEDGTVQAILHDLQMPFTGSRMQASAIAMDKLRTKWMWLGAGLPTPNFVWVNAQNPLDLTNFTLDFPVIVKPIHEGSSIGMQKVDHREQLAAAVQTAQQYDDEVLIEQWITGREYTAAVLNGEALPLIELRTSHSFYDFSAKYQSNDTQYLCPTDLSAEQEQQLQQLILRAFSVVGAQTWGRVDLMLDEQNRPWLIELNSVPGMTDHSLVPMAAKQAGISFEQLVKQILLTAS
ncbi:D-alanine--D-alanine ligase B [Thiosulfatimonas sediminis]|uniref:D-alanine--D-alanine ligase n=1 Tax=Thiosulfatimonas sediminis TaxID=2675054 RepID=A0A6F8PWW3_9GAMM|nr:D-alanine--D-alanine ligase [Thiosulfatimonas sediminis]BBP46527.1 D-alanine--D-alanine ligase B [Thiosulfatimonas sediminis]